MAVEERYEPEAVQRIIRRAMHIEQRESLSRQDLIEAAREVGIGEDLIDKAIAEEEGAIAADRKQRESRQKRLRAFQYKLSGAAILMGALFLVDAFSPGPWWFQWPLLGFAVFFALRARNLWLRD